MESIVNASLALRDKRLQTPTIVPLRQRLDGLVATLRQHQAAQMASTMLLRDDRGGVVRLKEALRKKHLLPIARRAKLVLVGYPGIAESLRVPHARADVKTHIAAARRIVKAVRPHSAVLVAEGFGKSFLTDCLRAAKTLEDRQVNPDTHRNRLARVTRSIPDVLREGRLVIATIDSHFQAEFGTANTLAVTWNAGKRVPKRKGRPPRARKAKGTDAETAQRGR
jgi:hypothetical protein